MKEINIFYKAPFGKLYKTKGGKKAIFVGRKSKYLYYLIVEGSPKYLTYFEYGRRFEDNDSNEPSDYDIVSEWDFTIKKEKFHIPNDIDLEKEIANQYESNYEDYLTYEEFADIAKHFFELGMCNTITEEDCKLIWNIGDEIPNMPEEEFFKELLKRYKAQKGE